MKKYGGQNDRNIRPTALKSVPPGSVAFYESVRPLFEEACDAAGFSSVEAGALDNTLWRMCMRYGPGEFVVKHFIEYVERQGRHTLVESIEEILDNSLDGVMEMIEAQMSPPWETEADAPEPPDWGIPDRPCDHHYDERVLPPLSVFRGTTPFSIMLCDLCNRPSSALVQVSKHGIPNVQEVCGLCVPTVNRESEHWQPYGQREHMRYT